MLVGLLLVACFVVIVDVGGCDVDGVFEVVVVVVVVEVCSVVVGVVSTDVVIRVSRMMKSDVFFLLFCFDFILFCFLLSVSFLFPVLVSV